MEQSRYKLFSEEVAVDANNFDEKEFLLWLSPDCSGTQFQAGNTGTWFFFGMNGEQPGARMIRLSYETPTGPPTRLSKSKMRK